MGLHLGVDLSAWQKRPINWPVLFAVADFAYIKYGEDEGYKSTAFAKQVTGALAAAKPGDIVGPYHYAVPEIGDDPKVEAARLVEAFKLYPFTMRPVLDFEEAFQGKRLPGGKPDPKYKLDAEYLVKWADACVDEVERLIGFPPIFYTYANFLVARRKEFLKSRLARCPLLMAKYNPVEPQDCRPWKTWDGWQHTNAGKIAGYPVPIDLNRATPAGFERFKVPSARTHCP